MRTKVKCCAECAVPIDPQQELCSQCEAASLRARLLTLEQALEKIFNADDLHDLETAIHEARAALTASRGREPGA